MFPYDDQGHGSHCAGTTAGTGAPNYEHTGVAPQAQLVGVKVLDAGGSGSFAGVMMGMEWTVDKRHEFNIRAASMSLGGPGIIEMTAAEEESVARMANEMVRSGVALFIAAGNNGVSAQIGTPVVQRMSSRSVHWTRVMIRALQFILVKVQLKKVASSPTSPSLAQV